MNSLREEMNTVLNDPSHSKFRWDEDVIEGMIKVFEKRIDLMIEEEHKQATYPDDNSILTLKQVKEMLK